MAAKPPGGRGVPPGDCRAIAFSGPAPPLPAENLTRPITFKNAVALLRTPSTASDASLPVTSQSSDAEAVTPVRHQGRPLSEEPATEIAALARAAAQRRLVIYAGAGLSAAPPACGPTGWSVADRLRRPVATMLGIDEAELATLNLEQIAEVVETRAPERLNELRETAATTFDFRGLEPNYGHEIAALLLREGLLEIVSANWDCAIEKAGLQVAVAIAGVATATQRLQLAHELPLYKIHGCAKRPQTLALTQSEVDRPQTWAVAQVQSALTGGIVVFVGLGTVGLYVREPLEELLTAWAADQATIHVVDPQLSEAWREALGERTEQAHHAIGADAFFDELIRAVIRFALTTAESSVDILAEHETWAEPMVAGISKVRHALQSATGDAVLRWWRDAVVDTQAGRPFITELRGQQAMMTVALLAGKENGPVSSTGVHGRMTMASDTRYYEIACRPGAHVSEVERVSRARVDRRRLENVYADSRPVVVVVSGAMGQFPAPDAPLEIAGVEQDPADISDVLPNIVRLVAAEDGVLGRLSA